MFRIGLTGGIASGKSTVSALFADLGVPIIDADEIAHHLVESHGPLLKKITAAFGNIVLNADGELNRTVLRKLIFEDDNGRLRLEAIMHPPILREMQRRSDELDTPYCILSIPLLVEAELTGIVDRILVIDATETAQMNRLSHRGGIDPEQARAIIATQATRKQRLGVADDVIENIGATPQLQEDVARLHQRYLELSGQPVKA